MESWDVDAAVALGEGAVEALVTLGLRSGALPSRLVLAPWQDVVTLGPVLGVLVRGDRVEVDLAARYVARHGYAGEARDGAVTVSMTRAWTPTGVRLSGATLTAESAIVVRAWGLGGHDHELDVHLAEALGAWTLEASASVPLDGAVPREGWLGLRLPDARVAPELTVPDGPIGDATLAVGVSAVRRLVGALKGQRLAGAEVSRVRTTPRSDGARVEAEVGGVTGVVHVLLPERATDPPLRVEGDAPWAGACAAHLDARLRAAGWDPARGAWGLLWVPGEEDLLHDERWELVGAPTAVVDGAVRLSCRVARRRLPLDAELRAVARGGPGALSLTVRSARGEVRLDLARARGMAATGRLRLVAAAPGVDPADVQAVVAAGVPVG